MEKIEDVSVSLTMGSRPSRAEFIRALGDEDRRKHPYRYVDVNSGSCPLFVENVAQILGCNVDFVRRIPRTELPVSRVGRRLLYLREDVLQYIATKKRGGMSPGQPPAANSAVLLTSAALQEAKIFDPIRLVKQTNRKDRVYDKKER